MVGSDTSSELATPYFVFTHRIARAAVQRAETICTQLIFTSWRRCLGPFLVLSSHRLASATVAVTASRKSSLADAWHDSVRDELIIGTGTKCVRAGQAQ